MAGYLLRTLILIRLTMCIANKFNVLSYDYIRRFKEPVDLGQCAYRFITQGNQRVYLKECALNKLGKSKYESNPVNESFVVSLTEENLLTHIALCDGKAASYMGLLYEGECLAVEIAEMVSFNETTYTRAFVEYYQTGTDELEIDWRPFEGYDHYYKKDYYLKKRSYGTYELIIAQMVFKDNTIRNTAQSLHLSPPLLSEQIEVIGEAVTIPESIRIIRVSTAEPVKEVTDFAAGEFKNAINLIKRYENDVRRMRKMVSEDNSGKHHLEYEFHSMSEKEKPTNTMSRRIWENITQMEIGTARAIPEGEQAIEKCLQKKKKLGPCKKMQRLVKGLKKLKQQLHNIRSKWYYMSPQKIVTVEASRGLRYDNLRTIMEKMLQRHTCAETKKKRKPISGGQYTMK